MGRRNKKPDPRLKNSELILYDSSGKNVVWKKDMFRGIGGFLVCGGPSLDDYDLDKLQLPSVISMGVNNAAAYARTTHFICADPPGKFHGDIFLDAKVCKILPHRKMKAHICTKVDGVFFDTGYLASDCPNVFSFVDQTKNDLCKLDEFLTVPRPIWGYRTEQEAKSHGRTKYLNAMFYGVRIMHYLGIRRLYLLGVDFSMSADRSYAWEGRGAAVAAGNNEHYRSHNGMFAEMKSHFDEQGFQVFNCAKRSGLTAFPHVSYADAIKDCTRGLTTNPKDLIGWYGDNKEARPGVDKHGNKWQK